MSLDVDFNKLPKSLLDIIDIIGIDSAIEIVKIAGGTTISIPATVIRKHFLYKALGREKFTALIYHYQGCRIEIPRCLRLINEVRNKKILQDSNSMSKNQIATKYGLTSRWVRHILSSANTINEIKCKSLNIGK
jgi:Mor family transcriptional regulator